MPPIKKRLPQPSIKEMFLKTTEPCTEQKKLTASIPDCLSSHIDIRPPTYTGPPKELRYSTSLVPRGWFRKHSNIDDIVRASLELYPENKRHTPGALISAVIREVISGRHRHLVHPYNKFKFNSPYAEAVGKEMLINSGIETEKDWETLKQFQQTHGLKFCSILMSKNNPVLEDAKIFVEKKRLRLGTENVSFNIDTFKFRQYIERKNFERQGLLEDVYLSDLDIKKLLEISNFGILVKSDIQEENLENTPRVFEIFAKALFNEFKKLPFLFTETKDFYIYPRYTLYTNSLSDKMLERVARNITDFFHYTNAWTLIYNELEDRTKKKFYQKFCSKSLADRRKPPFHMLALNVKEFDEDQDENEAGTSGNAGELSVGYKSSVRAASAVAPEEILVLDDDDCTTSEGSRDTVVLSEHKHQESLNNQNQNKEPENLLPSHHSEYPAQNVENNVEVIEKEKGESLPPIFMTVPPLPTNEFVVVAGAANMNITFVSRIKKMLRDKYPHNFAELWSANKFLIAMQFSNLLWTEQIDLFIEIIKECSQELQDTTLPLLYARKSELSLSKNDEQDPDSANEIQFEVVPRCKTPQKNMNEAEKQAKSNNTLMNVDATPEQQSLTIREQSPVNGQFHDIEIQMHTIHCLPRDPLEISENRENLLDESIKIKQEPGSSQASSSEQSYHTSDCVDPDLMCLGTVQDEVVLISESIDEDESMIAALNVPTTTATNENTFLQQINEGTQSDELVTSSRFPISDDTMKRIECFVPESARVTVRERKDLAKTLKETTNQHEPETSPRVKGSSVVTRQAFHKPCPKSKKPEFKRVESGVKYVDSENSALN